MLTPNPNLTLNPYAYGHKKLVIQSEKKEIT